MASMFESYEREVRQLVDSISKRLGRLQGLTGDQRKDAIRQADKDFREAEDMIEQMKLEARGAPAQQKQGMLGRVRDISAEITKLKADLKRAEAAYASSAARSELFQGVSQDVEVTSYDQRQRLLQQTERLQGASGRLQDTHRVALETEELGRGILTTMHGQRDQIIHARDTLRATDDNIGRARGLLRSIQRRIATNKCIMVIIILVLLGIIGVIIYFAIPKPAPCPNPPCGNGTASAVGRAALQLTKLF